MRTRTTLTILRVVSETFSDDDPEPPTLPGIRVVETDGTDVTAEHAPLAKCEPVRSKRRTA